MIWKALGFKRDIFFVEPLLPNEDDISLFVGRDKEIKKYLVDTLSSSRALKIVSGGIGVGKTSFVNACQYFSYMNKLPFEFKFEIPRLLPCFQKTQIQETGTLDDFYQQALTSICRSMDLHCRLTDTEPPKEVRNILSYFQELSFSTSTGGYSVAASALGFGGGVGVPGKSEAQNVIRNARLHLEKLVDIAKKDFGFQGVFVLVNNVDILSKKRLLDFLNIARDELFDIPGIYWTFIGREGIGSVIETEVPRVAHYLSGTELHIPPIDLPGTKKIIDKRVDTFRLKDAIRCPLVEKTISTIHYLSLQELRETLHICGQIVTRVMTESSFHDVIPHVLAMTHFVQYAHDRAKDLDLTESAGRILKAVYEKESCRPKDFQKFGYKTTPAFIAALKGLVQKRLLSVEERGRARIYRMTGTTVFAAITGALGEDIQKVALEKLKNGDQAATSNDNFKQAQLELSLDD